MELLIPSFFAGVLTILAPCILSLIPIILGGSVVDASRWRPLIITLSLGVSVVAFTLLLKATTLLIDVPDSVWRWISGGLILFFGFTMVFPETWNRLAFKFKLYKSEGLVAKSGEKKGLGGAVLMGAALGPVFTTCSPTYALILAVVLPSRFYVGLMNLVVYTVGLMTMLLVIGYGGQKLVYKFRAAANPTGGFKRGLGAILLMVGVFIITGWDKTLETKILDAGYFGPINLEQSLMENANIQLE